MPKLLGITGGIGAGKSTVGEFLKSYGVVVIDSDDIVHGLLEHSSAIKDAVLQRFGAKVRNSDGSINRKTLGRVVFEDPAARKDLESIVHPEVRKAAREKIEEHANEPVIALLIPLLFEAGMSSVFDEVWSVDCPYDQCVQRLKARTGLTKEEIDQRIQAQLPQKEKNALANAVIDNSGTIDQTRTQVARLLDRLRGG